MRHSPDHSFTKHKNNSTIGSMKATLRSRPGGASLLTTVILAILLIGVIGSLTVLSINELRQAANTEQSARALTAAETHVTDLAEKISTEAGSHERPYCNANPGDSGPKPEIPVGDNSAITCAIVKSGDSEETIGVVERDQSYSIDLSKAYIKSDTTKTPKPVTDMSIEWANGDDSNSIAAALPVSYPTLQPSLNWQSPAAPELTYAWWDATATDVTALTSAEDYGIGMRKVVFQPGSNGANVPNKCAVANPDPRAADNPGLHEGYACYTTSGSSFGAFNLSAVTVPTDTVQNKVFKFTARYNGTHFRFKFYNGTNLLTVPQPYAIIDVTARSNNLYRRVIAQKPLVRTQLLSYLDNVMFSGKNICKDMKADFNHGVPQYADGTPVTGSDNGKNTQACEN